MVFLKSIAISFFLTSIIFSIIHAFINISWIKEEGLKIKLRSSDIMELIMIRDFKILKSWRKKGFMQCSHYYIVESKENIAVITLNRTNLSGNPYLYLNICRLSDGKTRIKTINVHKGEIIRKYLVKGINKKLDSYKDFEEIETDNVDEVLGEYLKSTIMSLNRDKKLKEIGI